MSDKKVLVSGNGLGKSIWQSTEEALKKAYEKGKADTYSKILMYLNDASLAQSGKCYDCTRELMKIIEDMEAKDTNVLTKNGGEQG